jgi:serine/threonine-protein kinase
VADGSLSWARDFEHNADDIFELEDEISRDTIKVLKTRLAGIGESEAPRPFTSDSEAYTAYLKGRFHWNKRNVTEVRKSIGFFTEAIDADSSFASAYAGLADAYVVLGMYGAFSPDEVMPRARDAAERALQIDERLAEARVTLGCIGSVHGWQWRTAEAEFKRGIELSPNYATGHHWYSVNHLVPLGRFEEAMAEINCALSLDPVSLAINATVGLTHYFARDYDLGIDHFKRTLEMDNNFPMTNFFLGQAYLQKGLMDEALLHLQKARELYGESPNMLATHGYAAGMAGDSTTAGEVLDELVELSESRYVSSYDMARVLLGLGKPEEALKRLQQAFSEKAYLMVYLNVDPMLDPLRSAPEFQSLVQMMFGNLPR